MLSQRVLQINLAEPRHDIVDLHATHFIGPVEHAWNCSEEGNPTVLGIGPLAGTPVPGANSLVIAGHSPLWDGFYVSLLKGAGLPFKGLGCQLMTIQGRAMQPSVLVVYRNEDELKVQLEPLDPEPLWQGTHDGEGLFALLNSLAARYRTEMKSFRILATGPAAAKTTFGGICSALVEEGKTKPLLDWFRRGGFGSRLFREHALCAVVFGSDQTSAQILAAHADQEAISGTFSQEMSLDDLEQETRFSFPPKIKAWGTLGSTFESLRHRTFWFNFSSVNLSEETRDDLYRHALKERYLRPFITRLESEGQHHTCGEPCPLACKKMLDARLKEFEPYAALGPQIGVADHPAADLIIRRCEELGYDILAIGGILGWLMERLHQGTLDPWDLNLNDRPHWTPEDFDPVKDSAHNATLARELAEGLLTQPWGEPLRRGLRDAARKAGSEAAACAAYNANGESGEMIPHPYWAPGFFTPTAIAGEYHQYYGTEFVPPRVLGRKSAQRMTAELMLQNFGICRFHRGWAEVLFNDLVNRTLETDTDWAAHHHTLARKIHRKRKARFWETERVIDIIASFMQNYQFNAAPDEFLDRWVSRFREDKASAARAYWSEINAGMEEIFGS